MEGLEILLKDLLDRVKSNSERNEEQSRAISELQRDMRDVKEKLNDDTIYKAKLYDNTQNLFSKKMFWVVVICGVLLLGFGLVGILTNADAFVKIATVAKGG